MRAGLRDFAGLPPSYYWLWVGNILSSFGDAAVLIMLSWFLVDTVTMKGALGIALMTMGICRVVLMLVGGIASDRYNRRTIMFLSLIARGAVLFLFSLVILVCDPSWYPAAAFVMAGLFGAVDAFFWPASGAIVPSLVAKDQLGAANSLLSISQQISIVGGPLIASVLLGHVSFPVMFAVNASMFALGSLFIFAIRIKPVSPGRRDEAPKPAGFIRELMDGAKYMISIRILFLLSLLSLLINFMLNGPLNVGLPVLIKQLNWDGSMFANMEGVLGAGAVAGGIIVGLSKGFRGRLHLLAWFVVVMGGSLTALGFMQQAYHGFVVMAILGMMLTMIDVPFNTYAQTVVETHMLGRFISLNRLMGLGLSPLSYFLASFLLDHQIATPAIVLAIGGASVAFMGICLYFTRDFRRIEQHPAWRQKEVSVS
ncbi:MFS transporter [Paenibacillus sp. MSJ-34]|uniref:MFS transporter n=1 Tax=Paenibacillus sp. MSJ-34 TaxID=2841529 RepID=UPI001C0F3FF0|nr:MFS transporter [Paenibacillus sp. MSJ-34]MBU5444883.1 MFS transporter [Paenibacillus sp. MSJ-34]